jgi:thioredoxin-related protein
MRSTFSRCAGAALTICLAGTPALAGGPAEAPGDSKSASSAPALEWLEYGDALDRGKKENKHVIIDFYTNWCGWCKVMDQKTYGDSATAAYLNQHFVLSRINAESGKRFKVGEGTKSGVELAREFGVSSFPITWFLEPDGDPVDKLMGFVPPDRFRKALVYVHDRSYAKKQ